jgi:hypothetical protein
MRVWLIASCGILAVLLSACSGGGGSSNSNGSAQTQFLQPCAATACPTPQVGTCGAFDVWQADFEPQNRMTLTGSVDTTGSDRAAGFRLSIACQGILFAAATGGAPCSFPPPTTGGAEPECPSIAFSLADLTGNRRVRCLAEVASTEALGIGNEQCADPGRADYKIQLAINGQLLSLTLAADDCLASASCLQQFFSIDVSATATPAPPATPSPTASPTPRR